MSGPYREISVHLDRDALNTPWGFRLQGGKDFKAPLTIQRVFVGSPADGEVHRGDVILSIENHDATHMIHKQAMDAVKSAGGKISLVVRRALQQRSSLTTSPPSAPQPNPQFYRSRQLDTTFIPTPMSRPGQSFGVDYSHPGYAAPSAHRMPGGMLGRVRNTLDAAIWQPGRDYDQQGDEDYEPLSVNELKQRFVPPRNPPSHGYHPEVIALPDAEPHEESYHPEIISSPNKHTGEETEVPEYVRKSVHDLKRQFASPNPRVIKPVRAHNHPAPTARPGKQWKKPAYGGGSALSEPGWSPMHSGGGWAPVKPPTVPIGSHYQPMHNAGPAHMNATPSYQQSTVPHLQEPSRPAWAGSLKGSGSTKPWEVSAAATVAAAEVGTPYRPPQGPPPSAVQPHQPRVQNVHYGPGDGPTYQQHDPSGDDHEGAQVAHLQYNSPLALYSRPNVEDALKGQTHGKPGEGTMQVL